MFGDVTAEHPGRAGEDIEGSRHPPGASRKRDAGVRRVSAVEIVLDEDDCFGLCEVDVGQVFQNMRVIDGCSAVGDLDVAPAFERREHHEEVGHSVARVFVVDAGRKPRAQRDWRARFGDELLGGLVHTNHRAVRVARPRVNRQYVFHRRYERAAARGTG